MHRQPEVETQGTLPPVVSENRVDALQSCRVGQGGGGSIRGLERAYLARQLLLPGYVERCVGGGYFPHRSYIIFFV